jgi:hypothetical protein
VNTHAHEVDVIIEVGKGEAKANGRFNAGGSIFLGKFEIMFDVKKFTAFIAFNDNLRNLYYDMAESQGIQSSWDVYHIQEGKEIPSNPEIEIMKSIFNDYILIDSELLKEYKISDANFRQKVADKVRKFS